MTRSRASAAVLVLLWAGACSPPEVTTDEDEVVGASSKGKADAGPDAPSATTPPASPTQDPPVGSLANIGDSISQGFDADDSDPIDIAEMMNAPDSVFHDMPELSWIQGDARVGSVASVDRGRNPKLVVTPVSRSGAELVGRDSTVPNFEKQARTIGDRGTAPELVYVLLGGNDVCNRERSNTSDPTAKMYSIDEWRGAARAGLTALAEVLPAGATVRFLSMPRVDLLVDRVGSARVHFNYDAEYGDLTANATCQKFWSIASSGGRPICPIVTLEKSAERRKTIGKMIDRYNDALAQEVRSFNGDARKNPKNIAFQSDWHGSLDAGAGPNSSMGTFVFEQAHVSKRDCFHPSIAGQLAIASLVLRTAKFSAQ